MSFPPIGKGCKTTCDPLSTIERGPGFKWMIAEGEGEGAGARQEKRSAVHGDERGHGPHRSCYLINLASLPRGVNGFPQIFWGPRHCHQQLSHFGWQGNRG